MHRPRCRTGADHLLVRQALADGEHLPGSTATPWLRNPATLVGAGDSKDRSDALLGLFSLVALFAHQQMAGGVQTVRRAAWYEKPYPTFSDALALVRKELWAREATFYGSPAEIDTVKVPREFVERLTDAVCYAT
jgi:hypothetical protein